MTTMSYEVSEFTNLLGRINSKTAEIGVVGLGYVGLPNMVHHANKGYSVCGFDVDQKKVFSILNGKSYITDVTDLELQTHLADSRIHATTDFQIIRDMDVILICVPTPIDEYKQPNLDYVKDAVYHIVPRIKPGTLVILESTTYPGTTREIIVSELEQNGFEVGRDVFVAYSPERIDPANPTYRLENIPRVVGGVTKRCSSLAAAFLSGKCKIVSSPEVAELTKVHENTFRFVNIALANQLQVYANKAGINAHEVIDAAATKPYGFMPFYPSPGIGGHCIPVDPYYLSWKSKEQNVNMDMIELAGNVNNRMYDYTIGRITEILNQNSRPLKDSQIAILGASYKKDVGDVRESAILRLYESLDQCGAQVDVYDPYVKEFNVKGHFVGVDKPDFSQIGNYDLVVLLTDHSDFDYETLASEAKMIYDTRNKMVNMPYSFRGVYYTF